MPHAKQTLNIGHLLQACKECSLAELCLPRGLSEAEVEELGKVVSRQVTLQPGETLFRPGDRCNMIYAVRSGSMKSFRLTEDGGVQILGFHLPGELFGLDGLDTHLHHCEAVALETTRICELSIDELEKLCCTHVALHHEILRVIGREISAEHELLLLLGKKRAEERLAAFLISLCKRFCQRGGSGEKINLPMTRQDIGNYLGLAIETVSRLFARFQEQKLITVQRRQVWIHDTERLGEMAGLDG